MFIHSSMLNLATICVKIVKKKLLDTGQWNDQESQKSVARRT